MQKFAVAFQLVRSTHKTSVFLTAPGTCGESPPVTTVKPDRPYFQTWLRRTKRQFAVSGRLSQTAMLLANENGGTPEEWSLRLRTLLEGGESPSLDLLTQIDAMLAGPSRDQNNDIAQGLLF